MEDQAKKLRQLVQESRLEKERQLPVSLLSEKAGFSPRSRVIAISSGKGGVGKTNLVANLGIALAKTGKKVLIFDADLGLANVDILMDINPKYNLHHLISGQKNLSEIMVEGPHNIKIVPGASGISELADLSDRQREELITSFVGLEDEADVILIDTGSGISRSILSFILAAREVFVVTTPDPTAITDAYGLVKTITQEDPGLDIKLIVNMVKGEREAVEIGDRIIRVSKTFLNKQIETLGHIVADTSVSSAIRRQEPFILSYPNCAAAKCINQLITRINREIPEIQQGEGLRSFLSRLFMGGEAYEAS